MKKTIWRPYALILLWLCGMAGCQEKTENLPVVYPVLSTSNVMMPIRSERTVENTVAQTEVVFVCKSPGAKRYHFNQNCHGLKRCKRLIETLDKEAAENVGLTRCKYEN